VSRDRGATWQAAAGAGWGGGTPVITQDGAGKEVLFTGTSSGVQRSDDLGATWSNVGAGGNPSVSVSFATDQLVAVAGKGDYIVRGSASQAVTGSGGSMSDGYWAVMPGFPSSGARSPVLLGGIDSAGKAMVERCDSSFSCTSPTILGTADAFAGPPHMLPSTAYAQDGTVFAHTAEGVFKSVDGGTTFVPVTPAVPGATRTATAMTALSPQYRESGPDRRVWEAVIAIQGTGKQMTVAGDLYSSTDGGTTWTALGRPGPFDKGATAVAVAPDGRVFAGVGPTGGGGLLCSQDGKTWAGSCGGAAAPAAAAGSSGSGQSQQHAGGCATASCATAAPVTGGDPAAAAGATAASPSATPAGGALAAASGQGSSSGGGSRGLLIGALAALLVAAGGVSMVVRRRRSTST
jgi:hypothetical protein